MNDDAVQTMEPVVDFPADDMAGVAVDYDPMYDTIDKIAGQFSDVLYALGDLAKIKEHTGAIEGYIGTVVQTLDHPALTTPLKDYTVTEALLLLLLFYFVMSSLGRMVERGLSWLRS